MLNAVFNLPRSIWRSLTGSSQRAPSPHPEAEGADTPEFEEEAARGRGLSLFWRTFFLLALLLFGSILAWLQSLRALEFEPRALQSAQEISSLVNLSRAALIHSESQARNTLIETMSEQEDLSILPRETNDIYEPFGTTALNRRIEQDLKNRLGPETVVANSVNGKQALWVSFQIEGDNYWLQTDRERIELNVGKSLAIWLFAAILLSLAGSAVMAGLINKPLQQLSFATGRISEGDFAASRLDEDVPTSEIRLVNIGFNRMVQSLSKLEQDRAVMMAGISHDLRTPLARLRLETEMSVTDTEAKAHMESDIEQLDGIINKFMDYARSEPVKLSAVHLNKVIQNCLYAFRERRDMRFKLDIEAELFVLADEVELSRVISNLLENARRYGKSPSSGMTHIDIIAQSHKSWILIKIRDYGAGVSPEVLPNLTKPFFRGDTARTAATGTGLGLAIVEKTIHRMHGRFALANSASGGLSARLLLPNAHKRR